MTDALLAVDGPDARDTIRSHHEVGWLTTSIVMLRSPETAAGVRLGTVHISPLARLDPDYDQACAAIIRDQAKHGTVPNFVLLRSIT